MITNRISQYLLALIVTAMALTLTNCSSYETQKPQPNAVVVDRRATIEKKIVVIPARVLDGCKSLDVPVSGRKGGLVDTMLKNHETHGKCMFKNDLKTDFITAAADTKATFEIYHGRPLAADDSKPNNPESK